MFLLSKVIDLIRKDGWEINNIDSVLIGKAKIATYKTNEKNISEILNIDEDLIGIKATTMKNWVQKGEKKV